MERIRFLQVAQTITVHHGALAHLPGTCDTLYRYPWLERPPVPQRPQELPLPGPQCGVGDGHTIA